MAVKHGDCRKTRTTPEYMAWTSMLSRCSNENVPEWDLYGGRGIRVCARWRESYDHFLEDMGRRPSARHSLDRIDHNGNYEPSNCRWASKAEQARNRRDNMTATVDGVTRTLAEWSEITGIKLVTLDCRIRRGWSDDRAIKTPVRRKVRG